MFPNFATGELAQKEKAILSKMEENKKMMKALLAQGTKSALNFLKPYQTIHTELSFLITELSHLDSVCNSNETSDTFGRLLPLISEYYTDLGQNEEIFKAYLELKADSNNLTKEQSQVLAYEIRDFKLSGVGLEPEKKEKLKDIRKSLSSLSHQFSQNVLKATNSYSLVLDESEVQGLPQNEKKAAKKEDGKYHISLQFPSYIAFMTYADNREKRKELYTAYVSRAPENGTLIEEILKLRKEEAILLGFQNYAEVSLASKMASSTSEVTGFLRNLARLAKPAAEKELNELREFARGLGLESLEPYDLFYYSEKWKKVKCDFEEEAYRPYFEANQVVRGSFQFYEKLFGIEFRETESKVWNEKVRVFDLWVKGKPQARLYLDLEARTEKKGGAWMNNWLPHFKDEAGNERLPVAFVVGNFPTSSADIPSLLKPSDVVTFFHEMGHALHHLLSRVEEAFVSGVNGVEWDAVEFPSQFLENFAYEPKVLREFAKHYQTGEILPPEMIERMVNSKNFQSAMGVLRQIEFALFDLRIHSEDYSFTEEKIQKILDEVRSEVSILVPPRFNKFQNTFSHIFSGGYAAGYYSYKWAELFSANAFYSFVDKGIFDSNLSETFLTEILEKGGSESAAVLFKKFYGKDPDLEPLLRLNGIAA